MRVLSFNSLSTNKAAEVDSKKYASTNKAAKADPNKDVAGTSAEADPNRDAPTNKA